jgi:hypothetical protein
MKEDVEKELSGSSAKKLMLEKVQASNPENLDALNIYVPSTNAVSSLSNYTRKIPQEVSVRSF